MPQDMSSDLGWAIAWMLSSFYDFCTGMLKLASTMDGGSAFVVGALTGAGAIHAIHTYATRAVVMMILLTAGAAGVHLPELLMNLIHAWRTSHA